VFDEERLIRLALEEDVGSGDVTTEAVVPSHAEGTAEFVAKETLVPAGIAVAQRVFTTLDEGLSFGSFHADGDWLEKGTVIFQATGNLRALLTGERTALNFLQRLSGIASYTRRFADAVSNTSVRITDTRKTAPGWRKLEKYAVSVGGGHNHRFGLYDGILIKDNHIRACGGISKAVDLARQKKGHLLAIEVEVSDFKELEEALAAGVDMIMLDNMNPSEIEKSVTIVDGRVPLEVSGGVSLDAISRLAETGVDIISIGALTHSARAVDISMNIVTES
jgi:nicotinate-nucleotide pyrophosphorylase (carboxylating)